MKLRCKSTNALFLALIFVLAFSGTLRAEEPLMPPEPGMVEGEGTHFTVTDSPYLNVTVDSMETVKMTVRSVPRVITLHMESASGAASTEITVSGLTPSTLYYKYIGDFSAGETFTTDAAGSYRFSLDISGRRLVFIQPDHSTLFLRDDETGGDCASVGAWNAAIKTCTLSVDINETVQVEANDIILDGASHSISGAGTAGVYISGKSGVTVKNLRISGFSYGVYLYASNHVTIENNTISGTSSALYNQYLCWYCMSWCSGYSGNNSILNNTISGNGRAAYFGTSCGNTFEGNTVTDNSSGMFLYSETGNTFRNNIFANNGDGIFVWSGGSAYIAGNTFTGNAWQAITVAMYSSAGITGNTITGNGTGLVFSYNSSGNASGNTIAANGTGAALLNGSSPSFRNNNFIDNTAQATGEFPWWGGGNFTGNYWTDFDTPGEGCMDSDLDGYCDAPYPVLNTSDPLPWTYRDGWAKRAVANAGPDQVVTYDNDLHGGTVTLNGTGSTDPNGDALTYTWTWPGGSAEGANPTVVLPLGTTSVTLAAGDGSGVYSTDTVDVSVRYSFAGFKGPVTLGKYFKRQRGTIPVAFQLVDAKGRSVADAVAKLTLHYYYYGPYQYWYPSGPIEPSSNVADSGDFFRYETDGYIYNVTTDALDSSTIWRLDVELNDGSIYNAWVQFEN